MLNRLLLMIAALTLMIGVTTAASAQDRFALVIGNSEYRTVSALPNPARDAEAVSKLLKSAGFDVITATDLDQRGMRHAVRNFASKLADKGENTVALIYYAGHGVQIDGQNYLLPVDARVTRESDVALEGLRLADIMHMMDAIPSKTRIVILDACRDNPFDEIADKTGRGLALVNAPAGTLLAYSTSPGSVAEDGVGDNSPFTTALVKAAKEPGAPIGTVLQNVRLTVHKSTDGRQTPWEVTALTEPFLFFPGNINAQHKLAPEESAAAWRKKLRGLAPEDAYDVVILQDRVIVYEIFLALYPDTRFGRRIRGIMDRRIEMLAWFDAVRLNSAEAFDAFLKRYSDSDLAPTAKKLQERAKLRSLVANDTPGALNLTPNPGVRTVIKEVRVPSPPEIRTVVKEVKVPVVKEVVKIKEVKVPVVRTVVKEVKVPVVKTIVKEVKVPVRVPCKCPPRGRNPGFHPPPQFRNPPRFQRPPTHRRPQGQIIIPFQLQQRKR